MRSSCKGQCETCCHVTDQSQMGEIEEVEAYCGWDGHIGKPQNFYAYGFGGVVAKARPTSRSNPTPKIRSRAPRDGPVARHEEPRIAPPERGEAASSRPRRSSSESNLLAQVATLTREVAALRTELHSRGGEARAATQ